MFWHTVFAQSEPRYPAGIQQESQTIESTTTLIIGDSNLNRSLKNINGRRLSFSGDVRTYKTATIYDIYSVIDTVAVPITNVSKVVLYVGSNNIAQIVARKSSVASVVKDFTELIKTAGRKFPKASIGVNKQQNDKVCKQQNDKVCNKCKCGAWDSL